MSYINKQDAIKLILEERDKVQIIKYERYGFGAPTPHKTGQHIVGGIRKALRVLETMEVADVEPVRHGHWIMRMHEEEYDGGYPLYHCSLCDYARPHKRDNYCPNCGAKMDEVIE